MQLYDALFALFGEAILVLARLVGDDLVARLLSDLMPDATLDDGDARDEDKQRE